MHSEGQPGSSGLSLYWRVIITNAVVLLGAWAILAFTPARIESPLNLSGGFVGIVGLAAVLAINMVLLRRAFSPLSRLTALMHRADPLQPGPRIAVDSGVAEVDQLTTAFNEMLNRLETERRESAQRALAAQEAERHRLARELHDEIGQRLTAVLLQLEHSTRQLPEQFAQQLVEPRETARASLDELRRILGSLRPAALEDLGLHSGLAALGERVEGMAGPHVVRRLAHGLPDLSRDAELVIYRVAQEALTNAVRHAEASRIDLWLEPSPGGVRLRVVDDGRGFDGAREGGGIRGMRERALLVGAKLSITSSDGGVELSLDVPVGKQA